MKAFAKSIRTFGKQVTVVDIELPGKAEWIGWVLLRTDAHHDNAHCRRDLEKSHLDLAIARNALICDAGDAFCAMQGKYDPRSSRSALTADQAQRNDYLNVILDEATKFYQPYANNWLMMSPGNHETSILNRCGFDLTAALAERLGVVKMAYTGFVKFIFRRRGTTSSVSRTLAYHHGHGGGGPVTRGVIGSNRRAVWYPQADVIWSGHTHDAWAMPISQATLLNSHCVQLRTTWHVSTPGYKDEFTGGDGWAIERGHNPKVQGCAWLKMTAKDGDVRLSVELDV